MEDGKIEVIGPEVDGMKEGGAYPLAITVEVAGRDFQEDFESVLERRIHEFISCAHGIFHMGQRSIIWVPISKEAAAKGFQIRHFGDILVAKMHDEFSRIVDRVQVKIYTEESVPSDNKMITEKLIKEMIETSRTLSRQPGHWWSDQLSNHDGVTGYYAHGEEIWSQTNGKISAFVHTVGSAHSIQASRRCCGSTIPEFTLRPSTLPSPRCFPVVQRVPTGSKASALGSFLPCGIVDLSTKS